METWTRGRGRESPIVLATQSWLAIMAWAGEWRAFAPVLVPWAVAMRDGSIMTASVLPIRLAGQIGSGPGRPRYTACTSSRGQADGCRAKSMPGREEGTASASPSKVTLRHLSLDAAEELVSGRKTARLPSPTSTAAWIRKLIEPMVALWRPNTRLFPITVRSQRQDLSEDALRRLPAGNWNIARRTEREVASHRPVTGEQRRREPGRRAGIGNPLLAPSAAAR